MKHAALICWLLAWLPRAAAEDPAPLPSAPALLPAAQVQAEGVFLSQLLAAPRPDALPRVRIAEAPPFGRALVLSRAQIQEALQRELPSWTVALADWTGAERVQVTRRARRLDEAEVKAAVTAALQEENVRGQGTLELQMTRPWRPVVVPDDPLTFRVLELPSTGVSPFFIARFEVRAGGEVVGAWQAAFQGKVWREVWVARSAVRRGEPLAEANAVRERRDVLGLRETPLALERPDGRFELAENVPAGAALFERSVRLRPVMRRGQVVEAQLMDGVILISIKVELLEDGAPGQLVRVRNMQSKREFRGKVHDEGTILVLL